MIMPSAAMVAKVPLAQRSSITNPTTGVRGPASSAEPVTSLMIRTNRMIPPPTRPGSISGMITRTSVRTCPAR